MPVTCWGSPLISKPIMEAWLNGSITWGGTHNMFQPHFLKVGYQLHKLCAKLFKLLYIIPGLKLTNDERLWRREEGNCFLRAGQFGWCSLGRGVGWLWRVCFKAAIIPVKADKRIMQCGSAVRHLSESQFLQAVPISQIKQPSTLWAEQLQVPGFCSITEFY